MIISKLFSIIILFLLSTFIYAQSSVTTSNRTKNEESYLSADLSYISDAVFMGRKDSISAPYLYPSLTYHHKTGIYATGSFSYLTKSDESRIDMSILTLGYDFTSKNLSGDLSVTKYFFNDDSYNVISEVEADVTAQLRYDFDWLNINASGISFFNSDNSSDFFLATELSHDIITNNQRFQFSPTAGIFFGSQNFYDLYYVTNRFSGGRGQGGNGNGSGSGSGGTTTEITTSVSVEEGEKFNLMAIELSVPMWYSKDNFTISFLPTLVLPQSPADLVMDETLVEEKLDETLYWMIGISYKLD